MNHVEDRLRRALVAKAEMLPDPPAPPPLSAPSPVWRVPRTAIAAAAFGAVVILVGIFAIAQRSAPDTSPPASVPDATIFLVPTVIPDDLELSLAEVWSDGNSTTQIYLPPGQSSWVEGDRVVNIDVMDTVKMTEDVGAEIPVAVGDPEMVFAMLRQQLNSFYPGSQLTFDEITVRGKPAMVVERTTTMYKDTSYEVTDIAIGVLVLEGNGITSTVAGHQVARNIVIAISESLTPVTPEEFAAYTNAQ